MQHRLCLGTATLGSLTQDKANNLLAAAIDNGFKCIDTAFGYQGSEERIGRMAQRKKVKINTKVGLPIPENFNPAGIQKDVEVSLKRLRIDAIGTLFIHSLDPSYLTESNLEALLNLKSEGKVERLGYAGDGKNLEAALSNKNFDDFQMTFSIIDQSNRKVLLSMPEHSDVYYKLIMGQAIWRSSQFFRRLKANGVIRKMFGKSPEPDSWRDYKKRFQYFHRYIPRQNYPETFLKFAYFSGSQKQICIVSSQNIKHIIAAKSYVDSPTEIRAEDFEIFETIFEKVKTNEWLAHNG